METIGVADLEKYWITFEQLIQRWNIKEDLLASYCVHVDTSKGNTPLRPHFYQGEFSIPGGGTCKRLAKYEPEYKNAAEYLNKSKTELQLIQEFLESISATKKGTIWFLLSDVEELEAADYSLRFAAEASATNKITTELDYIALDAPITFEEILTLWIGKDKYDEIKSYDPHAYYPLGTGPDFDDYLTTIRGVENQLDSALRNGYLHLYHQRIAAGREFYYEVSYSQGELFAGTREGYGDELHKCFQFMWHYPDLVGVESEPLYFDENEVLQKFPFLKQRPVQNQNNSSPESAALQASLPPLIPVNIPASLWAGKTPEAIFTILSERQDAPEAIAAVLNKVGGITKTDAGRLFHKEEIGQRIEREATTYQRTFDRLLSEFNSKYLLTFNE